jgi:hypothetical protein
MNAVQILEACLKVTLAELERSRNRLQERGISFETPRVRGDRSASCGRVELEIHVKLHGQIVDVIELPIFIDGTPVTTPTELQSWLIEALKTVGVVETNDDAIESL